ncbi:hypothetical protein MMC25_001257 [Agyrium rufum]|nr:hypothetical protein [Agyrium rufum]
MVLSQAKVKSVLSGDTLILTAVNNPNQERTLSLAYVSAPRLRREGDEPFAFESRDWLRRLVVGKVIQFNVFYSIPTGVKREYGVVMLQGGQRLPDFGVSEGWLKLRDDAGKRDETEEAKAILEKLELEEAKAKADSKGVWTGNGGRIENSYEIPDPQAFVEECKGKSMDGIVERVLSGDRMIIRILTSPTKHVQTLVLVAGIRAPATKRTNVSDGKEQAAEPYGAESHQFVEARLLQRNVKVEVLGVSPQGQLICNVKHPNGSIAEFLLKAGLARCTDHHSTLLGGSMAPLRQAEKHAKDSKIGVFQGHTGAKSSSTDTDAVITRVQTADTVYVRNKNGVEKRLNLSSVRQPKPTDPKQSPFQADAKEFLRKRLIGKHVKVSIDGKKPASDGYEEREVATITSNNKNIALTLVEAGYASVIRHRRDDDDRSPYYDELLAAEEAAQKDEKGMWSPKPPAAKQYVDYSESVQKAKVQSSVLMRQKKVPAVVDFVKSASRFTLLIPRENAKLTFVLSSIRAPRSARNPTDSSEPFGQEAHDFANRRCMQRDVEIDVEGTDKVGGFIGALYINRENFAKLLLEEGFASVHAYSAEQSGSATEYFAAEKKAKEGRKGMWHDWDPSKDDVDADTDAKDDPTDGVEKGVNGLSVNGSSQSPPTLKTDFRDILVTHVDPETLRLKIQMVGPGTSNLTNLMSSFRSHHTSNPTPKSLSADAPPKAGEYVSALFGADKTWYRARVRRNDREKKESEIVYIDYGNEEKVPWKTLRPLPDKFNISVLKAQAQDAAFSFLSFAKPGSEYAADALRFLEQEVMEREMVANVDFTDVKDNGLMYLTVLMGGGKATSMTESVNAELCAEGLANVSRGKKAKGWERKFVDGEGVGVVKFLKQKEEEAKGARRGIWEYGDLGDEDEEDDRRR